VLQSNGAKQGGKKFGRSSPQVGKNIFNIFPLRCKATLKNIFNIFLAKQKCKEKNQSLIVYPFFLTCLFKNKHVKLR